LQISRRKPTIFYTPLITVTANKEKILIPDFKRIGIQKEEGHAGFFLFWDGERERWVLTRSGFSSSSVKAELLLFLFWLREMAPMDCLS